MIRTIAAATALLAVVACAPVKPAEVSDTRPVDEPAATVEATEGEPNEAPTEDEPATTDRALKNSDFKLGIKELDKTCYGSGLGCSIEYRVTVKYVGPPPKPTGLVEVTYEVRGGTEGPQKGTIQLEDGKYDAYLSEDYTDTPSRSRKLTAKVLSVETFG